MREVLPADVLACTALGGAALINAYAGYLPPSTTWVYTPPGYRQQPTRHYPVVYLFHGYPGTSADWFRAGRIAQTMDLLIAHRLVPAAIVVAPDLNGGGIHDTEGLDAVHGPRIASWFTRDVVGWTDSHLRTSPDRGHRIVGGMSSGGYAALDIALHHLDEFGAVLAQEPYCDPGQDALSLLGDSQAAFRAHSPVSYLPGMRFSRPLPVFCDVGADGDPHNVNGSWRSCARTTSRCCSASSPISTTPGRRPARGSRSVWSSPSAQRAASPSEQRPAVGAWGGMPGKAGAF